MSERKKIIDVSMYTLEGPRVMIGGMEYVKSITSNQPQGWLSGGIGCSAQDCPFQDTLADTVFAKHKSFADHAALEHTGQIGKIRLVYLWRENPDFVPPPKPRMDTDYRFVE
ncbi:MAG: hypothetical protein Q8L37_05215 [Candidatus Gottesmanbacteria bacterium]|nr:hypothetical protein [Candidatus Gottesmanbacteria bacterium]